MSIQYYKSRRNTVGLFTMEYGEYRRLYSIVSAAARDYSLPVVTRKYTYPSRWVIYINQPGLPASLHEDIIAGFEIRNETNAVEARKAIDKRIAHESHILGLRAKLWGYTLDELMEASIAHFGSRAEVEAIVLKRYRTLNTGTLVNTLSQSDWDIESVVSILTATPAVSEADLKKLKVSQLRDLCKQAGLVNLPSEHLKAPLIELLLPCIQQGKVTL